jgi:hypothetical protein
MQGQELPVMVLLFHGRTSATVLHRRAGWVTGFAPIGMTKIAHGAFHAISPFFRGSGD